VIAAIQKNGRSPGSLVFGEPAHNAGAAVEIGPATNIGADHMKFPAKRSK
jgi:hypothetical protein